MTPEQIKELERDTKTIEFYLSGADPNSQFYEACRIAKHYMIGAQFRDGMDMWVSVETPPEDENTYWLYDEQGNTWLGWYKKSVEKWIPLWSQVSALFNPTHWQPLPNAPRR